MKITRRNLVQSGLATAATTGLGALGLNAHAQSALRVAAFVPEQSFGVSRVIKPWMAAVERDLPGKVKLQGFWGGTLGKDAFKQFELVKNGVADIAWVLPGYTPGQFPEMQALELPNLFRDAVEAGTVAWRLYEKNLLKGFDGVRAITIFATEPMSLWMRQPINGLEDLRNKKIRSPGAVHAKWLDSFGASAETMDSPDMNEMLNRGTLDGAIQGTRRHWALGYEIVLCARLIKGYGATNERGKDNLLHVLHHLAHGPDAAAATAAVAAARQAALTDEAGTALDATLRAHGAPARPVKAQPIRWMRKPTDPARVGSP